MFHRASLIRKCFKSRELKVLRRSRIYYLWSDFDIYILIRYRMALRFCPSVILFVRYRNHFPVVQFQHQAHIRNPHGTGQVSKTLLGDPVTPIFFYCRRRRRKLSWRPDRGAPGAPNMGRSWHPNFFYLGSARTPSTPSLRFACNHLYLRFGSIFVHK